MWRITKTAVRLALGLGGWLGIVYAPADIIGLPETYPFLGWFLEMERETALVAFSGLLICYLVYVELRPYWKDWRKHRSWLSYPQAAQLIYEEFRDNDMVIGLIRDSGHPRPVEDVMSSWIEDGINKKIIHALGRLEHSREDDPVPCCVSIETNVVFERSDGAWDDEIAAKHNSTGQYWRALRFRRREIIKYLDELKADTVEFERRKTLKKKSGTKLPTG